MMRRHRPQGLTLIELLVAVSILALLTAAAIPSFDSAIARRRVIGAANELAVDLQYTRSLAVSKNTSTYLYTNSTTGYIIADSLGTSWKTVTMPSNVSITNGVTVTFSSLNGTTNAATTTFFLSNSTTGQAQVVVNYLGRVQLQCNPSGTTTTYVAC